MEGGGEDRKNVRWPGQQNWEPAAAAIQLAMAPVASAELVPVSCATVDLKGSGCSGRPEGIEQGGKGREEAGRSCREQQRIWSEA